MYLLWGPGTPSRPWGRFGVFEFSNESALYCTFELYYQNRQLWSLNKSTRIAIRSFISTCAPSDIKMHREMALGSKLVSSLFINTCHSKFTFLNINIFDIAQEIERFISIAICMVYDAQFAAMHKMHILSSYIMIFATNGLSS